MARFQPWRSLVHAAFAAIICLTLVLPGHADSGASGVIAIAAGGYHTVALKSDGSVLAWGNNGNGQSTVPEAASSGVSAIAAGFFHTAALKSDGSVLAWGGNGSGQSTVPEALSGVIAIAAGAYHTVALKSDGSVLAWGNNNYGQRTVPVTASSGVIAIATGAYHTVALKSDGSVLAWGHNGSGQSTVPTYTVSVNPSGTVADGASVAFTANAGGLNCSWDGVNVPECLSGNIIKTTRVVLTAQVPADTAISDWGSGCGSTTATTCTIDSLTADMTISPVFALTYAASASAGANGSLDSSTPSPRTVIHGSTTNFTFTAAIGYHVSAISGCGGAEYSNSSNAVASYTYITGPITAACTVSASFGINLHTLAVTRAGAGTGSINAGPGCTFAGTGGADSCTAAYGTPITLSGSGAAGSTFAGWSSGSGSAAECTGTAACTFDLTQDSAVIATFTLKSYTVTPSAGAHGRLSPATPQSVSYRSRTSFGLTPDPGYMIGSVSGCGGTLSAKTFTTGEITGNCTVTAAFKLITTPVTLPDSFAMAVGETLTVKGPGVLANDTAAAGLSLTAVLVRAPAYGTSFSLNSAGGFIYVHDGMDLKNDSFTYKARDGQGRESAATTVTILIHPWPIPMPWLPLLLNESEE
jgi:hypothetical protein